MNYLDFTGTILSLLGTYYFIKADIRMWPVYISATILNSLLYFKYNMHGTMYLEILYLCLSVSGWLFWQKLAKDKHSISFISHTQILMLVISWLITFMTIATIHMKFASIEYPLLEAFAISASIFAYILSARKLLQCWLVWIIADGAYAILMAMQGLQFHTALFICYLFLACQGLKKWLALYNQQASEGA